MRNVCIAFGSENICKSQENNIASDDFLVEVRTVACVTVPLQESCVVLRLCDGSNGGWSPASVAGGDRRVHARMSGDRSGRSFTAQDVMGVLQYLFAVRGTPEHIRSDNGSEFISKVIRR